MIFRQPQPDFARTTKTPSPSAGREDRAKALKIAAHCQCREFADMLEAHLIGQKQWSGEELERLADHIRRVAWARQRGEV